MHSFSVLNSRISSFSYGDDISDHPKPLPETYFTSGSLKLGGMSSPTQICMYCAIIIMCACDIANFVTSTG